MQEVVSSIDHRPEGRRWAHVLPHFLDQPGVPGRCCVPRGASRTETKPKNPGGPPEHRERRIMADYIQTPPPRDGGSGGVIAVLVVIVILLVAGFLYFTQYGNQVDDRPDIELNMPEAPDVDVEVPDVDIDIEVPDVDVQTPSGDQQ